MESTVVTAMAAAVGSLAGAAGSIATTWITQRTQTIRANAEWRLREREALYREFIAEGSRLAVDAVTNSLQRPDQLIALYGILGRIRLLSADEVVAAAENCLHRISELYDRPNMSPAQITAAFKAKELDPLKEFSVACRKELLESKL